MVRVLNRPLETKRLGRAGQRLIVPRYSPTNGAHAFEQARGGSGAWYAMELTELLPHVARGLNIDGDEAIRYAGLTSEF